MQSQVSVFPIITLYYVPPVKRANSKIHVNAEQQETRERVEVLLSVGSAFVNVLDVYYLTFMV